MELILFFDGILVGKQKIDINKTFVIVLGNRIYLTIDCRWKGKLDGVCSEHVHPK